MLAASTKGNACAGFDSRPARVSEEPLSRHCAAAVIALGGQCSGVGASKRSGRAHARPGKFAALSRIPSSPPVRGWVGGVGRGKGGWRKREDLFFRFGRLGARPDGLTAHLQPPPSASRVLLIRRSDQQAGGQARRAISSEAKQRGADGTRGGRGGSRRRDEAPRRRRSRRKVRRLSRLPPYLTLPYLTFEGANPAPIGCIYLYRTGTGTGKCTCTCTGDRAAPRA